MASKDQPSPDASEASNPGRSRRKKIHKRQLRVAFDTNVLYNGSASDLVRQEVGNLMAQAKYPDLELKWYLPEIVRFERQYQMQKRALDLYPAPAKIEKLLGHNLNITQEILIERVERAVLQRHQELGFSSLKVDYASVDWERLLLDAAFRRPPFQQGETEKGFRDSMVVESFLRLVSESPKTTQACRLVLVTGDALVTEAIESRTAGALNVRVVADLEELKGLINALVSEVDEAFVASLKERVSKLFFVPKDESTLYYKERIRARLTEKFKRALAVPPAGATSRKNGTWRISRANFSKKAGQRISGVSRIEIEAEARKTILESPSATSVVLAADSNPYLSYLSPAGEQISDLSALRLFSGSLATTHGLGFAGDISPSGDLQGLGSLAGLSAKLLEAPPYRTVVSHKGVDVYEVLWSVDVTASLDIRRPSIDDLVHIEANWEASN